jgi:hypothetical protein
MKNILELYQKATFTVEENELINNAIEEGLIDTTTIKENFMDYVYHNPWRFGYRFVLEDIWDYIDENYSNGCTHIENYNNLLEHLNNI